MLSKTLKTKALAQHHIIVKPSAIHRYGVIATKDIPENTLIEECVCLFTDNYDKNFHNYYFKNNDTYILPTGFGLIYNHAPKPNATYLFDEAKNLMIITSNKHIRANEEIFISYGENWFTDRNITMKKAPFSQKLLTYLQGMPLRVAIVVGGLFAFSYLMNVLPAIR